MESGAKTLGTKLLHEQQDKFKPLNHQKKILTRGRHILVSFVARASGVLAMHAEDFWWELKHGNAGIHSIFKKKL